MLDARSWSLRNGHHVRRNIRSAFRNMLALDQKHRNLKETPELDRPLVGLSRRALLPAVRSHGSRLVRRFQVGLLGGSSYSQKPYHNGLWAVTPIGH